MGYPASYLCGIPFSYPMFLTWRGGGMMTECFPTRTRLGGFSLDWYNVACTLPAATACLHNIVNFTVPLVSFTLHGELGRFYVTEDTAFHSSDFQHCFQSYR